MNFNLHALSPGYFGVASDEALSDFRDYFGPRASLSGEFGIYANTIDDPIRLRQTGDVPVDARVLVLDSVVNQGMRLETRMKVFVVDGPAITVQGDSDQLEQLLINLIRNAVDAAKETGGGAQVRWEKAVGSVIF